MCTLIYFSTGNSYRCYNTSTSTSTSSSTVPVGSFCYQQWCTGSIVPVRAGNRTCRVLDLVLGTI
eukprot:COSAG02_NODE_252_length_26996_cov_29.825607_18_plen_65_part_00